MLSSSLKSPRNLHWELDPVKASGGGKGGSGSGSRGNVTKHVWCSHAGVKFPFCWTLGGTCSSWIPWHLPSARGLALEFMKLAEGCSGKKKKKNRSRTEVEEEEISKITWRRR